MFSEPNLTLNGMTGMHDSASNDPGFRRFDFRRVPIYMDRCLTDHTPSFLGGVWEFSV